MANGECHNEAGFFSNGFLPSTNPIGERWLGKSSGKSGKNVENSSGKFSDQGKSWEIVIFPLENGDFPIGKVENSMENGGIWGNLTEHVKSSLETTPPCENAKMWENQQKCDYKTTLW